MNYQIETFCDNLQNANTYLVYTCDSCVIVDPANNLKVLQKYIENRKIEGVLLTHGHYDHFKMLKDLMKLGDFKVYMHKNAKIKLENVRSSCAIYFGENNPTLIDENRIQYIQNGETINLSSFKIKCWYTPGHTNCMMCYIIDNNLFSGDFLFKDGIGRTDLDTGSAIRMMQSLEVLKKQKINYNVYPGHGDASTLNKELKYNYYLQTK